MSYALTKVRIGKAMPDSQEPRNLAELVQQRRVELGLSQPRLAALTGLSTGWFGRLESGSLVGRAKPETLAKLAPVLRVDLVRLLRLAGYEPEVVAAIAKQIGGTQAGSNHAAAMVSRFPKNPKRPQNGVMAGSSSGRKSYLQASDAGPEGIPSGDDPAEWGEMIVSLPVYGPAACGVPPDWNTEEPVDTLYLPASWVDGVDKAIRVCGSSMSGYGISDGDTVLVKHVNGERIPSGKPVVLCVDGAFAVKMFRRDEQREFLEEYVQGAGPREVEFSRAELVGVVVRSVNTRVW